MKRCADERGSVLILTALSMTVLMGFVALAIDAGNLYLTQSRLQTLADTAAMAGALEASSCSAANCAIITTAATTALAEATPSVSVTLFKQCAAATGTGILLTINNGPCALGASDPNNLNANYVEAVVTQKVTTYFAGFAGLKTITLSARSEAGKAIAPTSGPCMNTNSLTMISGARLTDATGSTCGINDNATSGLSLNSGVTVNVGSFTYAGTSYNKNCGTCTTINPLPTTGSANELDPFASLAAPAQPATSTTNTGTISGATTLQPGTYTSGLNFNTGTYTVTLSPGLYDFTGGMNVNSNVTIQGTGVTLFFPSGASVNMNSAANLQLTAPAAALSNCASCAGMLMWMPSGNLTLDSASTSSLGGAVYVPNGTLTLNTGSNAGAYGMIYAQSIMLNSAITLSCASMPGGICPGGTGGGTASGSTTIALAE